MTIVLLVRHGRTAANAKGVLAGRSPGVGLDAAGRRQARSLGSRLRDLPLGAVVHSPLERCVQTADAILAARPGAPIRRHVDDRLTECDYGSWTGRALTDLAKEPLWSQVQRTPSQVVFPDGEAMSDMAGRSLASVRFWVAEFPEGMIALVSHGDVIKAILSDALAQPFDEFQRIAVAPASVSTVGYGPDRTVVLAMNDVGGRPRPSATGSRPTLGGGAG